MKVWSPLSEVVGVGKANDTVC